MNNLAVGGAPIPKYRLMPRIRMRSKQKIYIKPVGTDVLGGPRSYRSPPHIRLLPKSETYRSLLL